MPITYKIIENIGLIMATGEGHVSYTDVTEHLAELANDPRYTKNMKKIVDYRNIESLDLDHDSLVRIAKAKSSHGNRFRGEKCAFVVRRDVDFGLARMHGSYVDDAGIETNVFKDMDKALLWLGLDKVDEKLMATL